MKRAIGCGLLASALSSFCLPSSQAVGRQTAPGGQKEQEPPQATTDPLDGFPAQREVASVPFYDPKTDGELVSVGIYPESPNSPVRRPGTYYHRPLFALKTTSSAIKGYPSIVLRERPEPDGSTFLGFAVSLTSDKLQTACRNIVLKEDRDHALQAVGGVEHKVVVNPWPLQGTMLITCRDKDTQLRLASWEGPISTRKEIPFSLRFSPENLSLFKKNAGSDQIVMDFYYHYRSVNTSKGSMEIKGDKSISVVLKDVLGSRSGGEPKQGVLKGMPVFQDERRRIERLLQARVERNINADPDVLALLQVQTPILVDRLLMSEDEKALDYNTLSTMFDKKELDLQISAYLKPLLAKLNDTKTDSNVEVKIQEDEKVRNQAEGGGVTLIHVGNVQTSDEQRRRALDRIEKESGMTFTQVKGTEYYEPHLIKVSRVRDGWDHAEFDEKTVVYVSKGSENQWLTTPGVPISFTKDIADQSIQAVREKETYEGVPIGTVMMWWGNRNSVPPGWELCDGKEVATPGAIMKGIKPNLVDRFPKGASDQRFNPEQLSRDGMGGSNNMPALKISNLTSLSTNVAGSHTHELSNSLNQGHKDQGGAEVSTFNKQFAPPGQGMRPAGDHQHSMIGHVGPATGINADGGDTSGANQPAYSEIFFVIRVN